MVIKQRAMLAEDKEFRAHAILDAAEQLMLDDVTRLPSVDEVAAAAGLAKGTVYLYFPSKEEMLLALHARNAGAFFTALLTMLRGDKRIGYADMIDVVSKHILRHPGYLPLASRVLALMDRDIPIDTAVQLKLTMAAWLNEASSLLPRHFRGLTPEAAFALLCHSYAVMLGMWQLMHPIPRFAKAFDRPELVRFKRDYVDEVLSALNALWRPYISRRPTRTAPAATRRPTHRRTSS